MKQMNKLFIVIVMLLLVLLTAKAAWGAVVINEVMYNPSSAQGDDTDLEWIELYNNGAGPVDLTTWTIDGNDFDDVTLAPEEHLIVAKELLDGTDADVDSFESFYGNGDGVWDASDDIYQAVDGDFSLTNTGDTITLTNGVEPETVTYNPDWGGDGNGKSIEKKDVLGDNSNANWQEGNLAGTPGAANNVAPIAQDVTGTTEEDTEITVPLTYTDDDGNLAESCKVFNEKEGSVTSCSCTAGVCTAILKPNPDSIKTITADYTINDGTVDSDTAKITVTVTEKNDPPTLSLPDDTIAEDSFNEAGKKYELWDYASDAEDSKDKLTFEVKSQSDTSVVNCQLTADKHTLECKTLPDKSGESKVVIGVSDTKGESATDDFIITVAPVNDPPVIEEIPDSCLTATEGVTYLCQISVSDIDSKPEDMLIAKVTSDKEWTWLKKDKLTLSGIPDTAGTSEISLIVSDNEKENSESEAKKFNLNVTPALEITEVKVNGETVEEGKTTIPVQAGEEYTIEVKLTNNLDLPLLGVAVNGEDLDDDTDISFKDKETNIYLAKGSPKTITLTETAPNTEDDGIQVGINAVDLLGWGKYSDQFLFSLVVKKPLASLKITDAAWEGKEIGEKAELYCAKDLSLVVHYDNYGAEEVTNVNVVVEDNSGNEIVLDSKQVDSTVSGGETGEATLKFNTDNIKSLVFDNPFTLKVKLSYDVKGFPLSVEINTPVILKHDCFTPPNPLLELYEGEKLYDGKLGKEVNLKTFTPSTQLEENKEEVSYTEFTDEALITDDEEKVELATCTLSAEGMLTCTPKDDVSGTATLTIALNGIEEKVNVKVNPTIKISDVKVKGKSVEEGKSSTGVKPLEEFTMDITVTNHWDSALKYVKFEFGANGNDLGLVDKEFFNENIAPGSSKPFPIIQKLTNQVSGGKPLTITVKAKDETLSKDKEVDDTFDFYLTMGQEASEVQITKMEWSKDAQGKEVDYTYCNPELKLLVDVVNSGETEEDDIKMEIKDESGKVLWPSNPGQIELSPAGMPGDTYHFEGDELIIISTMDMASGEHTLTATLTYHNKQKSDSKTIKLTKQDCLNIPADKLTITEDDSGIALDLKEFLVGEEDQEDAQNGGLNLKFNLNVTNQSNKDLISCNIVYGVAILHCDWPFGTVPPDNALAQSLKEGESKTNEVEVTLEYVEENNDKDKIQNKETFTITVTGENDKPAFTKDMSISFDEDETAKVKLSDYVKDPDNNATELTIQASGNEKVAVTKDGENLTFSAEKDWSGTEEFELTVKDPVGASETKKIKVKVNPVDDLAELGEVFDEDETTTGEAVGPITENENYELSIGINNPDGTEKFVKWSVDGVYKETDKSTKTKFNAKYTFNAKGKVGEFIVKAVLTDKSGQELGSKEWTITTTDKPLDLAQFGVNEEDITNVNSIKDLTLKNSYGEIKFKSTVDLSNIAKLADVVKLEDKLVAIDSNKAKGMNKPATITLYNTGLTNPVVKKTTKFTSDKTQATEITSIKPAVSGGTITFDVDSFSTYVAVENVPAALEVSAINVDSVDRNTTVNTTFTIKNIGSLNELTNLKAELVNVDAKYAATLSAVPTTLAPGGEPVTITLTLTIPKEESSGSHSIGSVKVSSNEDTETVAINLNPKSALTIESVEVNGKKNGELSLEKENEFEVRVQNDYTKDMEDVTVTVTILDVDGDDIDEEADSFDLDTGDDDVASVKFDLSNENVDEDEYMVEILVEGDADDDSTHETLTTMKVKVDRQKHQVLLNEVELSSTILECNRQASLDVELKNIGKSDEDDVQVKVKNTALGMELIRDNIELDDYSGNDNTYDASFNLNLEGAAVGTYPITVEMHLNGKLEETDSVSIEVKECLITSTVTQQQPSYSAEDVAQQMQQQLQQQLSAKKQAEQQPAVTQTATKVAFRDTPEYTLMLGTLVLLGFIAIILAFAVLMKSGKRKVE